jgi:hypothetical protein
VAKKNTFIIFVVEKNVSACSLVEEIILSPENIGKNNKEQKK